MGKAEQYQDLISSTFSKKSKYQKINELKTVKYRLGVLY